METTQNHNAKFRSSSAQEVVMWYRKIGQDVDMTEYGSDLVDAATLIAKINPEGFMKNGRGIERPECPYILDAASMLMEASRNISDEGKRTNLRKTARGMLASVAQNPNMNPSARVDAMMYVSDIGFDDLYDQYLGGKVDYQEFSSRYNSLHSAELVSFARRMDEMQGHSDFKAGKFLEWFVLVGERHQLLIGDMLDKYKVSSASTRQDGGMVDRFNEPSGNFDLLFEEIRDGIVAPAYFIQIKLADDNKPYKDPVQVRKYNIKGKTGRFVDSMRLYAAALDYDLRARADDRIHPGSDKIELINEAISVVDSYYLEAGVVVG